MLTFKEIESYNQIHLSIHKPTLRYLDEFIKLKCAPDLLNLELFPNAKEITESMAAFNAVRKNVVNDNLTYHANHIMLLDVGSGNVPRTAALFAFRTKWDCIAIDPQLPKKGQPQSIRIMKRLEAYEDDINNLIISATTFEHFCKEVWHTYINYNKINAMIICAIHAHIRFEEFLSVIKIIRKQGYIFPIYMIYMPCCKYADSIKQENYSHNENLIANYTDYGIWSPMRDIYVYYFGIEEIEIFRRSISQKHILILPKENQTCRQKKKFFEEKSSQNEEFSHNEKPPTSVSEK